MTNAAPQSVTNLSELLSRHVQEQPERIALGTSDLGTVLTYRQLDALIQSARALLSRFGLKRGDTVALVSDNSVEFVVSLFAIASLGGRVAPLNPALTLPEFATRLSTLSPYGVIVPRHLVDKLQFAKSVVKNISCWIIDVEGSGTSSSVRIDERGSTPKEVPTSEPHTSGGADEVALLVFTGGTTGARNAAAAAAASSSSSGALQLRMKRSGTGDDFGYSVEARLTRMRWIVGTAVYQVTPRRTTSGQNKCAENPPVLGR